MVKISDKILSADRDTDFLLSTQPQSRFEILNRISVSNRNVAFLLEVEMKTCYKCKKEKSLTEFRQFKSGVNKGRYGSYCHKCRKEYRKEYMKRYYKEYPWRRTHKYIISRCCWRKGNYRKHKIKDYITTENLKFLWFRDKAYLMKHPSIDRIDEKGHYALENCRYIELSENIGRSNSMRGRVIKQYRSQK